MDGDDLPAGWCPAKLDDVFTLHRGVTYRKPDARVSAEDGYLPLLRANNIDQVVNFDDLVFVPEGLVSDDQRLQPFDIIIAMSSGSKRLVGKAAQIKKPCDATFGAFCAVARPSETMEPAFVGWFMQTREYRQSVSDDSKGSNINNLKRDHVLGVPFRVPPLPEQQRIVEKIETLFAELDKGEEALREVQKLLARYRQSVLKAAVTGTLTADWRAANGPHKETGKDLLARILEERRATWQGRGNYPEPVEPKIDGLPALPTGWSWASVDQVSNEMLIGLVRAASLQNTAGDGAPYIKMDRIDMYGHLGIDTDVFVDVSNDELERFALVEGDVLFNTRNSLELVGKVGIVRKKPSKPTVYNNNLMRLRFVASVMPAFLNLQMASPIFRKKLELVKRATTSVAAVYGKDLKALPIAVPPIDEQQEIIDRTDLALAKIRHALNLCDVEMKRSAALRQSILKDAFAGKLVPQDPSDEPAEKLLERIRATRAEKPKAKRKKANA